MEQLTTVPSKGFTFAVKDGMNRLLDFNGRSRRADYWWFALAWYILSFFVSFITGLFLSETVNLFVSSVLALLMLSITVRRLHDTGRSGWWVVASWVLSLLVVIYLAVLMSDGTLESGNPDVIVDAIMNPFYLTLCVVSGIVSLILFIFMLLDSKPEENKYGKSPKYVSAEEAFGEVQQA